MRINLLDLPEEGKQFHWSTKTGEINLVLSDLIKNSAYEAEFFIRPINNRDFDLTGIIRTQLPEQCSRCGLDFTFGVNQKFHEILIPEQKLDRGGKYARVNHISDIQTEELSVSEYQPQGHFDMGEFLHEQVALALSFNPAPPEDDKGNCSICEIPVRGKDFSYKEDMPEEPKANPFNVLKNLKIQ